MSILDDVLTATVNGSARVVRTNHDRDTINWVRGMSDPGEMIACGAYQELRRLDNEADDVYQARISVLLQNLPAEVRDKIMAAGRKAALERFGVDTTANGEVAMFTDDEDSWWHGLGTLVTGAVNASQARLWGKIDFPVGKLPYYKPILGLGDAAEGPTTVESDRAYYIVRGDTGATLADYAGPDWEPIQADQATDMLDKIIGEFGARYATAGSLYGGRKIWIQIHLPKQSFTLPGGDEVQAFGTWVDSRVPGEAGVLFPTDDRVVCKNTLRIATSKDSGKGLRIRHNGNLKAKLDQARTALGVAVKAMDDFKGNAEVLTRTPLNVQNYANDILDAVLDVTAADALKGADALAAALQVTEAQRELEAKSFQRKIDRRESLIEDILARYDGDKCAIAPVGSAWRALNAVTEHADHSKLYRFKGTDETRASRRFESSVAGDGDEIKQVAYRMALAAAN
jgi:phage/plasmid-like protein (TIGR03299 family)